MIEKIEDLKSDYLSLVGDLDFDQLELELDKPNLFEILGATNNELRHSNMLAWIFNPHESHGLYNSVLKRFLREVANGGTAELDELDVEELDYSNIEIRREWNNIDLLILFDKTIICIENKIWSKETGDQLVRYKKVVDSNFGENYRKIYVYLTPKGDNPTYENENYVSTSYSVIVSALERILKIQGNALNDKIVILLQDYLTVLKRFIMQDDKVIDYARRLYKNHRRVFDFVFDNKPDLSEGLKIHLENKVKDEGWIIGSQNKGVIRFTTSKLDKLLPKNSSTWGLKEMEVFSFEIDFWWNTKSDNSDTRIFFKAFIAPNDNLELHNTLTEVIESIPGCKKASGAKWKTYYPKKQKFPWDDVLNDIEEIDTSLEKIWPFVKETVLKMEEQLLLNMDEIIATSQKN